MAFSKPPHKSDVVSDILEILDVPENERSNLSENLNKMSKASLVNLGYYIKEMYEQKQEDPLGQPDAPIVPLKLMPNDIKTPKSADDVMAQLNHLPTIGERLCNGWASGNFPFLKRNLRIIERITDNCRRMVARQLYDSIKIQDDE